MENDVKEKDPFAGDELQGPELRAKFKSPDDGDNEMFSMVTPGFPPYILIVFEAPGSCHFKMLKSTQEGVNVGPYMLHSVVFHLDVISRFNALNNLMATASKQRGSGILTPGMELPPNFDPSKSPTL